MKTYTVQKNQSIIDVAIQLYGNVDAVPELLRLNGQLLGGRTETWELATAYACDISRPLTVGMVLNYDERSNMRNGLVLNRLQQYADDEGNYVLATASGLAAELRVEPVVPDPGPDPNPYLFHADTLVFLDDRVADEPGGAWSQYFTMDDALALDRLVRDLHGESNPDYTTVDIWGILKAVYPVMGSDQLVHEINLVNSVAGAERISWSGITLHGLNKIGMDGLTGLADTGVRDGMDTMQNDMCLGIVVSNYVHEPAAVSDYPNTYIGATDGTHISWIRNIFGKYEGMVTSTSGAFGSTTAYQANDYLHMQGTAAYQALYLGSSGMLVASKAYVSGTESGENFTFGKVGSFRGIEAEVNLAYISKAMSAGQRKSMMNAVNYFLYRKGVRAGFTAIV